MLYCNNIVMYAHIGFKNSNCAANTVYSGVTLTGTHIQSSAIEYNRPIVPCHLSLWTPLCSLLLTLMEMSKSNSVWYWAYIQRWCFTGLNNFVQYNTNYSLKASLHGKWVVVDCIDAPNKLDTECTFTRGAPSRYKNPKSVVFDQVGYIST